MATFVIETKGNSVTENQLMVALAYELGAVNIVSVKRVSAQPSVEPTRSNEDDPHGLIALQERLDQENDNPFGW